jgi:hypothetical protein
VNTAPTTFSATLEFGIPLKTVSGGNSREHWAAKAKRVKAERAATGLAILVAGAKGALRGYAPSASRIIVTLTRVSPRALDVGDNLPASLKGVRDELAKAMGLDDRDPRCAWVYEQRRGRPREQAVDVEISMEAGR